MGKWSPVVLTKMRNTLWAILIKTVSWISGTATGIMNSESMFLPTGILLTYAGTALQGSGEYDSEYAVIQTVMTSFSFVAIILSTFEV